MLIIHAATHAAEFIDAWHVAGTDTYDFAFQDAPLEVKATERSVREHDFALAQVRGRRPRGHWLRLCCCRDLPPGYRHLGLLATSLFVCRPYSSKNSGLVLAELGQDAEEADRQTFDLRAALDSIRLIPAARVPAQQVNRDDEAFVSNVRFRANVANACEGAVGNADTFLRR